VPRNKVKGEYMTESKRKFKRFDLVRDIKFRPTYGATEYFPGAAFNMSCEGLGLEAHDFRFIMYENLDLIVVIPGDDAPVYLSGDIMWKRQDGDRCLAGIKFRMKDKLNQAAAVEKIFSASGIPVTYMYNSDFEYRIHQQAAKVHCSEINSPDKQLSALPNKLGVIKQYFENGNKCKVTFRLLREVAKNPRSVTVVGDFNGWDISKSPMTRLASGDFVVTVEVDSNREFRFRYLIDGQRWEIDWYADKFVRNDQGSKDSVVIV